jgi:hypothetical protein
LPDGLTLTTEAASSRIAKRLHISQADIINAWQYTHFTWHGPTPEQANKATRNIQVWQVLALMEMGLIPTPEGLIAEKEDTNVTI